MAAADSIAPTLSDKQIAKFWSKIAKGNPDECWPWQGWYRHTYGSISFKGKPQYSHVLALWLTTGVWPSGLHTCHSCDNPACCNPAHLFLGTDQDNSDDKCRKGRVPHGESHYLRRCPEKVLRGSKAPHARLTEGDVRTIKALYAAGHLQKDLADQFGLCQQSISDLLRGKTWKHVS